MVFFMLSQKYEYYLRKFMSLGVYPAPKGESLLLPLGLGQVLKFRTYFATVPKYCLLNLSIHPSAFQHFIAKIWV